MYASWRGVGHALFLEVMAEKGGPALLHFLAAAVRAQNFALFVVD